MNSMRKMSRRSFVVTAAAAGGGLALGFDIPFGGPPVARAQDGSPEINAWVVVKPDDTVVIRVARSEMGQGTATGLCQLVAEELECDWSKVTWEYPTPGQSVARNRVRGAILRLAAAAASARRMNTCVRAAPSRAKCSSRPRPTSGRCRFPN